MVMGAHVLLYSEKPEEDRTFFRDVLRFKSVDAGGGWLIFSLPPAELAVHPKNTETGDVHAGHAMIASVLYLMCDDLRATVKMLEAKKVQCTEISTERWGIRTTMRMPSGAEIGLYQPTHPTALGVAQKKKSKPRPASARRSKKKRR